MKITHTDTASAPLTARLAIAPPPIIRRVSEEKTVRRLRHVALSRRRSDHSWWVRTQQGHLAEAMPAFARFSPPHKRHHRSNSILRFIKPDLYLTVLDPQTEDFKTSAQTYWIAPTRSCCTPRIIPINQSGARVAQPVSTAQPLRSAHQTCDTRGGKVRRSRLA